MKQGEMPIQGTVRKGPISLKLGFAGNDYGFAVDLGLPANAEKLLLVGLGRSLIGNLKKVTDLLDEGEQLVTEA